MINFWFLSKFSLYLVLTKTKWRNDKSLPARRHGQRNWWPDQRWRPDREPWLTAGQLNFSIDKNFSIDDDRAEGTGGKTTDRSQPNELGLRRVEFETVPAPAHKLKDCLQAISKKTSIKKTVNSALPITFYSIYLYIGHILNRSKMSWDGSGFAEGPYIYATISKLVF